LMQQRFQRERDRAGAVEDGKDDGDQWFRHGMLRRPPLIASRDQGVNRPIMLPVRDSPNRLRFSERFSASPRQRKQLRSLEKNG
jgi:hypothetical protein